MALPGPEERSKLAAGRPSVVVPAAIVELTDTSEVTVAVPGTDETLVLWGFEASQQAVSGDKGMLTIKAGSTIIDKQYIDICAPTTPHWPIAQVLGEGNSLVCSHSTAASDNHVCVKFFLYREPSST